MIDDQNILTKRQFITGVLDTSPQRDSLLGKQPFEIDRRQRRTESKKNAEVIGPCEEVDYILPTENQKCYPSLLQCLGSCISPFMILCPCFCSCSCCCQTKPLFAQQMNSHGLLQSWGKFTEILQPGLHVINPVSQRVVQVNRQTKILENQQVVMSRDNVQFTASFIIFYRIVDTCKLAYRLGNDEVLLADCMRDIACGAFRSAVGENLLQRIIDHREEITDKCTIELNKAVMYWGIFVQVLFERQPIIDSDITFDRELQGILSNTAQVKRSTEAMLVHYRAEVECGKLIAEAAKLLSTKAAMQIRYLNMVNQIANEATDIMILMPMQGKQNDSLI